MSKMTDKHIADDGKKVEEVIKALEFCSHCVCDDDKTETKCPYYNMPFCKNYLRKQSLDVINRQQAEINRQKAEIEKLQLSRKQKLKEIERLKKGWKSDVIETENIKSEVIKDILLTLEAEALSSDKYIEEYDDSKEQKAYNQALWKAYNLVKEMVGECNV